MENGYSNAVKKTKQKSALFCINLRRDVALSREAVSRSSNVLPGSPGVSASIGHDGPFTSRLFVLNKKHPFHERCYTK